MRVRKSPAGSSWLHVSKPSWYKQKNCALFRSTRSWFLFTVQKQGREYNLNHWKRPLSHNGLRQFSTLPELCQGSSKAQHRCPQTNDQRGLQIGILSKCTHSGSWAGCYCSASRISPLVVTYYSIIVWMSDIISVTVVFCRFNWEMLCCSSLWRVEIL